MRTGGQASHVVTDASRTLPIPDEISLEAAASMPVTYITAHHMLHHLGNLKPSDSVLIHGGGGGVGTAALQLCQWAGVSKVWSTASAGKGDIIRSYGAVAIDRHNENFVEIVRTKTNGRGVDHILDPIGGEHLKQVSLFLPKVVNCTPMGCHLLLHHPNVRSGKRSRHYEVGHVSILCS